VNAPLAFLDCETDGLHPGRQAWEIAIIRREPDGKQIEWQAYIDINLSTPGPMGLRIGRFYERHPMGRYLSSLPGSDVPNPSAIEFRRSGGVLSEYAAAQYVARLTHGCHLVGGSASHAEVLDRLLRGHFMLPAWQGDDLIDIEVLALGYIAAHGLRLDPPYKSDDLTTAMRVEPGTPEERHTALGDARWAMRMYDAVLGGNVSPLALKKDET
jgi:hypothetical protein